jgi:N6-L-threonylcarbamoyladenine synthase
VAHGGDGVDPERLGVILALETSCDDTCAAVVTEAGDIRSNVISSQGVHDRYGGVVPEIASRHHLELIGDVVDEALALAGTTLPEVETVAVTRGPGLVAALLVGVATAKGLAAAYELPLAPVDHLHGHVAAAFLGPTPFEPPFLSLIASGGHTLLARVTDHGPGYEVIGQTLDDAAGEAFDKGARMLGLGYPGGPALEQLARDGDPDAFAFPTGQRLAGLDFSFAGLKTALLYKVRDLGDEDAERRRADLAASYQRAIVESRAIRGGGGGGHPGRARARPHRPRAAVGRRRCGRQRPGPRADAFAWRRAPRSAPGVVHRQRRDDRQRRAVLRHASVSGLPRPRRVRDRRTHAGDEMTTVVLYSREGCCLCDDAREILERVRHRHPFSLEERDIDADDALLRAYLERIPVVTIEGVEAFELFVNEPELEARLDMVQPG